MKIDRMFFERFEDTVRQNDFIAASIKAGKWDRVIDYVNREVFDKPEEYYSLDKLRHAAAVDRRLTLREILEKIFGLSPGLQLDLRRLFGLLAAPGGQGQQRGDYRSPFQCHVVHGECIELLVPLTAFLRNVGF